jgi:hypothetical protein
LPVETTAGMAYSRATREAWAASVPPSATMAAARANRVRVPVPRRVLDDAYTWLEDGVMDACEGTRPWSAEDIPAGRIR